MKILLILALFTACFKIYAQDSAGNNLLTLQLANELIELPLKCIQHEYPNKLAIVYNDSTKILQPHEIHPTFYGCFDWHSSVHGHWLLVSMLRRFPNLDKAAEIRKKLNANLTETNIAKEIELFNSENNNSFERTYGWAWLAKLQQELNAWQDVDGQNLARILRPLTDNIILKFQKFLPKLVYPIRSGEHPNTAFGLSFILDYSISVNDTTTINLIKTKAKQLYGNDQNYNFNYEPSGSDFLSPGLEEIELMSKVLEVKEFEKWLKEFCSQMFNKNFYLEPGIVKDKSDGKLVHLDGLNMSRAWCLYNISRKQSKLIHLKKLADTHLNFAIQNMNGQDYMGQHWLASFLAYAIINQ